MVTRVARGYAGRDVELADLVQDGVLGLLRALERFEPSRGVPFAAYAGWWLRQAMQQAIAEQSRSVRLPTHVLWDVHQVREARGEILASQGREASPLELERALGWTPRRLDDVLRAERPALSLDAPYQGDENTVDRLGDLIGDPLSEQAYDDVLTQAAGDSLRTLLSMLTERERQVLQWRVGLDGVELSLRQIGRRLGMSAERVRQIEQRALVKLRSAVLP
jgi:RNA polymerase sigma factor (sigma-70 family)